MIKSRKIGATDDVCNYVQRLYETVFPIDERRDFHEWLQLLQAHPAFDVTVFYEDTEPIGFISVWTWDDWRYVEHFAVDASCRGRGVGADVLRRLLDADSRPLVLEVEPPIDELSRRRIAFYNRVGLVLHDDFAYVQPPYSEERNSMPMKLMTYGAAADVDLSQVTELLHREVYGVK